MRGEPFCEWIIALTLQISPMRGDMAPRLCFTRWPSIVIARSETTKQSHFGGTGILPVIPTDRRDACPTNGDCFGLRPRNDIFMVSRVIMLS